MTTVYADTFGFNTLDATAALQAAIDAPGVDKVIVRDQGSPWLISKTIKLRSNQEIYFEPNVVVRAKSGSFLDNSFPLFQALAVSNIKLTGAGVGANQATLSMNKNEFSDTNPNAYSHIIGIDGADNYTISGLTLTGAGGDGIIIDGANYGQPIPSPTLLNYSDRGVIDNVTATNNRRNGLSVISAQNLTVTNSRFNNSSGTQPSAGIDFEPDYSYHRLSNINLNNVDISDNYGNGLMFSLSALDNNSTPVSININGATIDNNRSSGINLGTYYTRAQPNSNNPSSTPNGVINISNVTISGTKGTNTVDNQPHAAISVQALSGDLSDPNNLKVNFSTVAISDTNFNVANPELSATPIFIRGFGGPNDRKQIGNLSFNDVTVTDNYDRSIVSIQLNRNDGFINNITGNIRGINPNGVTTDFTSPATPNNFTLAVTSANSTFVGTSGEDTFTLGQGTSVTNAGKGYDTLIVGSGSHNLLGGADDDTYLVDRVLTAGTIIDDTEGTNDTLTLTGGASLTATDISRTGTTLLIDFDRNGVFDATKDLSIKNYFANPTGNIRGTGFIENLTGVKSATVLNLSVRNDFNGDGNSDILWRNNDGSIAQWQMNGTTVTPKAVDSLTADWTIAGTGDFNGDRNADMLLGNTNGSVAIWQLNGATISKTTTIGQLTAGWSIAGTGDLNGDGTADIILKNTDGTVAQWQINNSTVTAATSIGTLTDGWSISGTADFNGDGKADILLKNTDGRIAEWQMNGSTVLAAMVIGAVTPDWKIAVTGDFNGDGKSDLLYRNDNGSVAEWRMNGSTVTSTRVVGFAPTDWQIAGTGDYNGDGKSDLLWRNDLGGVATWQLNGYSVLAAGATSIPTADTNWKIAG
jgi:hypothetical protein